MSVPERPEEIHARVLQLLGVHGDALTQASLKLTIGDSRATHLESKVSVRLSEKDEASSIVPHEAVRLNQKRPRWHQAQELVALTKEWKPKHRELTHGSFTYEVRNGKVDRVVVNGSEKLRQGSDEELNGQPAS